MRPNLKGKVLAAAASLAEEQGMAGVTLDRAAARAGLTKAGVLYHFRSKQALVDDIAEHLVDRYVAAMTETLGKPLEDASEVERGRAYVRVADEHGRALSSADGDGAHVWISDELSRLWTERSAPWRASSSGLSAITRARLEAVRLAADGLWLSDVSGQARPTDRGAVLAHLRSELDLCEKQP